MKISELLALSFLLFAFTTLPLPGAGADDKVNVQVRDIFHHPLTTDHVYYIYGNQYEDDTNLQVTLAEESTGIPRLKLSSIIDTQRVAISNAKTANDTAIDTDTNLNFQFNFRDGDLSPKWTIGDASASKEEWLVTIGGDDSNGWFQISEYEGTANYKLLYCPKSPPLCDCECKCVGVGLVTEDGVSYLSPNPNLKPFPIAFGTA